MIKVLFLAAEPSDIVRLRLGKEFHDIQEQIQLAKRRDDFILREKFSVRPRDISQTILDEEPQIVHFSGHGSESGALYVENDAGQSSPLPVGALGNLFEQLAQHVKCVVLNACYSETQAQTIAQHIDFVIGTPHTIGDQAAINFSIGFYQGLGAGRTIEQAYKLGCAQLGMQADPAMAPILLKREQPAETVPVLTQSAILVVGSGVVERVLRLKGEPQWGGKQSVAESKEIFGGSGLNYTLRLGHAGYQVLPVLSIGEDLAGQAIQKAILQQVVHPQVAQFVKDARFYCDQLTTPESMVLVSGGTRTIFSGRISGFQSFDRFVENRLEQVRHSDQLAVKAVMIGHIYADGTDFASGREGQITTRIIDRYAERNAIIFTNFGRSQFQLGNQFWRKALQKVTVFQLALEEIREFFQQDNAIRSLRDMITWFQDNEITAVITMDRAGAIATLKDGQHGVIFARPYDLGDRFVDSTGAGDAFGAGLVSYFVDKVVEAEKHGLRLDSHGWEKIITIGNLEDAIERARCWAAHCCTTLGAASDCPTTQELEDFRKKLGRQASAVVKKGHLHDFEDILWLVDKAY